MIYKLIALLGYLNVLQNFYFVLFLYIYQIYFNVLSSKNHVLCKYCMHVSTVLKYRKIPQYNYGIFRKLCMKMEHIITMHFMDLNFKLYISY